MFRSNKPRLMTAAALSLLPLLAPGESHLSTDPHVSSEHTVATAHVMFKIVIPQVLAMDFEDAAPSHIRLTQAGHRAAARFESCMPAGGAAGVHCTVSTP